VWFCRVAYGDEIPRMRSGELQAENLLNFTLKSLHLDAVFDN